MKRHLFLLPAIAAGLLAGWGASRAMPQRKLTPVSNTASSPQPEAAPTPGTLAELADARLAPPSVPDDAVQSKLRLVELSRPGRSPVRSALEAEVYRSVMSVDSTLSDMFLADENAPGALESISRLARRDPVQALALVDEKAAWKLISASYAETLRRRIFREWVKTDPQAALAHVLGDGGPMAWQSSSLTRGETLLALVNEWATVDPAAASRVLNSLPETGPGHSRTDFAEAIFSRWHATDPNGAKEWAATQSGPVKERLDAMAAELAAASLGERVTTMLAAPQKRSGSRLVFACADWLSAEPAAAVAAMVELPDSDEFWQSSAASVVQHWAATTALSGDSAPDTSWLEQVPAGPKREAFLEGLVAYGASNDLPFAREMVARMAEGRPREQAMGMLTELWMRKDPVALSEWLAEQPAGASRDAAVARFAALLAPSDPEAAEKWAETLPAGSSHRTELLRMIPEQSKSRARSP